MNVVIPPEFEAFARQQVAAGAFASAEEAVAAALRDYLAQVEDLRCLIDPAIAEAERGETVDGRELLAELLAKARTRRSK